jgi:hypothetical protein
MGNWKLCNWVEGDFLNVGWSGWFRWYSGVGKWGLIELEVDKHLSSFQEISSMIRSFNQTTKT